MLDYFIGRRESGASHPRRFKVRYGGRDVEVRDPGGLPEEHSGNTGPIEVSLRRGAVECGLLP